MSSHRDHLSLNGNKKKGFQSKANSQLAKSSGGGGPQVNKFEQVHVAGAEPQLGPAGVFQSQVGGLTGLRWEGGGGPKLQKFEQVHVLVGWGLRPQVNRPMWWRKEGGWMVSQSEHV